METDLSPRPPLTPLSAEARICIFEQVNEHIRATEAKSLQVSGVNATVNGIALSIIFSQSEQMSPIFLTVGLLALSVFSYIGFAIQDWYRAWKAHYVECAAAAWDGMDMRDSCVPYWLSSGRYHGERSERLSIDNWLSQSTLFIGRALALGGIATLIVEAVTSQNHLAYWLGALAISGVAVGLELIIFRTIRAHTAMLNASR